METSTVNQLSARAAQVVDEIERVIVGKRPVIRLTVAAMLAGGHVLLDDIPGVGKTTLAKSLARSLGCSFKRIQFTPDLLPSDITGTSIFNQQSTQFEFRSGPIFANVVLADEINRATPKVQSSLLECMEETQVTVDGVTRLMPIPFFIIATQNNIEHQSTYPLPEAQLDRFMIRISMGYPSHTEEVSILDRQLLGHPINEVRSVLDEKEILTLQNAVKSVHVDDSLKDYIVSIVAATRDRAEVALGVSPRGSLALMALARALAALDGREYLLPDDVKAAAVPVLAHRLMLGSDARSKRITAEEVVRAAVQSVHVPVRYE